MKDANKETLRQANAAISRLDFEGFLALCTEDTEWAFVGDKTLRGKEAVRQWMPTAYPEPPIFQVQHMVADGDWLTAIGEITLKNDAGEFVRHSYCDVWRFKDGKLHQLQAFVIPVE
ncbi:nuclear transport factor 2 family protein [Acidovorax sp. LjRoot118]|uniref:nuclear transport factor 2 family protein n=1 Tax=unclassified Acidovorax TaxID=2684926 RepID=UPI00070EC920|nr:nuclear transport factor 2 family protein [Acidovorax sp. Root217]KRC24880.1 ketosteroid isomerase [Acidovorax sp. Root217]